MDANRTRKDFVADQVPSRVAELVYSGTSTPVVGGLDLGAGMTALFASLPCFGKGCAFLI